MFPPDHGVNYLGLFKFWPIFPEIFAIECVVYTGDELIKNGGLKWRLADSVR